MPALVNFDVELVTVDCGGCGMIFAVPSHFDKKNRQSGASFRCPNVNCAWGSQSYGGGENKRLRKQLEEQRKTIEYWKNEERLERAAKEAERRSHRATKGHLSRQKKRSAAGVCPCCNRTFKQLARHMKSKHPNYVEANS